MNYYQARQVDSASDRADAGKWRYTCRNDDQIWAIGYCSQGCLGHDTAEEAEAHQREYELDRASFHEGPPVDRALSRSVCEASHPPNHRSSFLTTSFASIGPGMPRAIWLCLEHLNREGLAEAYEGPGMVISS